MKVYILKHPVSGFSGQLSGVTFDKGIGSTSSERDAQFCIQKKGCKDVSADYEAQVDKGKNLVTNYVPKKKGKGKNLVTNYVPKKKGKGKGKGKEAPKDEKAESAEPEKK